MGLLGWSWNLSQQAQRVHQSIPGETHNEEQSRISKASTVHVLGLLDLNRHREPVKSTLN